MIYSLSCLKLQLDIKQGNKARKVNCGCVFSK